MIGIIGAMAQEVERLKAMLEAPRTLQRAGMTFFSGKLLQKEAVVVQSGIGKVNAALCTQILTDLFAVDCIINTGIAGALQEHIHIGDIVLSTEALQHDVDASAFGYPLGQIPGMKVRAFPCDPKLRQLALEACRRENPEIGCFEGPIVSGDQFIAGKEKKRWLRDTFSGYCAEMEGAAIAQGAYLNQIPCLIIRAISDKADDCAQVDYPAFEKKAIEHCVNITCGLVQAL